MLEKVHYRYVFSGKHDVVDHLVRRINVHRMTMRRVPIETIADRPNIRAMRAEMRRLAPTGCASRSKIDMQSLSGLREWIFEWDLIIDEGARVQDIRARYFGSVVSQIYGDMQGRSLREHPKEDLIERAFSIAGMLISRPEPCLFLFTGESEDGRSFGLYNLFFPLFDDEGRIRHVIALVEPHRRAP